MPLRIREIKNITVLDLEGSIDINSSEIIETIGWLVNTGKLNVILNFENVDLVDYSGLSILAIAYKNVSNHNGKMRCIHVTLPVMELFKLVKLDSVFENYPDEDSAVESFFAEDIEKLRLRRKFTRLDIHLKAQYKLTAGQKEPKAFGGDVLNISAAGIYIYSAYILPVNSLLDLDFSIPGKSHTLEASGKVVWLADKEIQPHSYPGMGVAFVHLTDEKEKAIIDFIDKNITHRA